MTRMQAAVLGAVLFGAALAAGYWWGAKRAVQGTQAAPQAGPVAAATATKKERKILYYRNPMGLPDTSPVPKKDPMGMDYIPVYEGEEADRSAPPGTVRIAPEKIQLLGVRTEPAEPRALTRTVRAVGTVQPNERLLYKVAPRFEGWIERLHVNTTGQAVARGQPLMEVYSPDLVTAQEEYLIALRAVAELQSSGPQAQALMQRLAEGALRRLRNWEISEAELQALQQEGRPRRLLTYRSAASGVVLQKPGVAGMRFMPGEVLFEIADLSSVWVLADVFEQELGLVHVGQEAKLRIAAYPGKSFSGKVVFIYPTLDPATRTARVRMELPNPSLLLKPAMYGEVELAAGHARGKVLAIPDTAVLDSGTRQAVLVRRGEGLFEPRTVKLGMRADGYIEVLEGLEAGEQVVVRANFLIDAESNLKAAFGTFGGGHGGHGGPAKSEAGTPEAAQPAPAAGGEPHKAKGTVAAIDEKTGSVEISHEAIPSLRWPAMQMEFKVKDRAMLAGLKKGAAVEFELTQGGPGEFVITRITPASAAAHRGH
ncbi:MAG: efflux RND transporter periplasmic adaptor subunit [Pseudomonadota bacterium]|jgi:Cu(I)/Ag(I) efflux system membrane fusion protein